MEVKKLEYFIDKKCGICGGKLKRIEVTDEEKSTKDTFVTPSLVDIIPPSILTGPSVLAIGETSATLVWTTGEKSDTPGRQIRYRVAGVARVGYWLLASGFLPLDGVL